MGDHSGGQECAEDDQLDPEEQDGDENEQENDDRDCNQQSLSEVDVPEVRPARPEMAQRFTGYLTPAGMLQFRAAGEPPPTHSPLNTIGSHNPPWSQLQGHFVRRYPNLSREFRYFRPDQSLLMVAVLSQAPRSRAPSHGATVVLRWRGNVAPSVTLTPLEPSAASVSEPWSRRLCEEQRCSPSKYRN
jgi:hypothetical protein